MSRLYNTFNFVGNVVIPKDQDKFHNIKESEKGWEGHRLSFGIQESKTNSVFVEMYGGYSKKNDNKVLSFSKGVAGEKGSKLEIPWDDRLKQETIDMVADFKRYVVDLTTDFDLKEEANKLRYEIFKIENKETTNDEDLGQLAKLKEELKEKDVHRKEFASEYDAINFLSKALGKFKDYKFKLTGAIDYNEWKGVFYRKFKVQTVEIVPNDTPSKLNTTYDIFFTKDSIDDKDFKKDKKTYINGYVINYDNKAKKDAFFPQQFILNAQNVDFENELHVKRLEYFKKQFEAKPKKVYHSQWSVNIIRGAEQAEFTINDLTKEQKEQVELGITTLEALKPKGGVLGGNIEESRLVKPFLVEINKVNDFRNGAIESEYSTDDLDFVTTQDESYKDVAKQEDNSKQEDVKFDELDDLFA